MSSRRAATSFWGAAIACTFVTAAMTGFLAAGQDSWVLGIDSKGGFPCRAGLSTAEAAKIREAVASAKPATWKPRYAPAGDTSCCDRFHWTLKLARLDSGGAERTYTVEWFDGNEKFLPADLAAVFSEGRTLQSNALARCDKKK